MLPQRGVANLGIPVRSRSRETLEMGAGKSSVRHTFNSNRHCGDRITRRRPPLWIARSILGRDRHAGSNAVNSQRDSVDFDRTHCRYGAGCSGRRARCKLFHGESFGVRGHGICAGTLVRSISHGENRVSVCGRHARHYRAYSSPHAAWIIALHRFFEVSVGILVALAVVAVWPEHQPESAKQNAE